MGHIISVDNDGHLIYEGLLSSKDIATADEMLASLKEEISQIENELKSEYKDSVYYKYYLGLFLGELLDKYNISTAERRRFWDEIKIFATTENRIRNEGKKSSRRSFYEQCYVLSRYDLSVVEKLSWRQWQDILDRASNREDERIFDWIKVRNEKIREDDWREFEKALHLYLKNKDTSVFSDEELFKIYDSILAMSIYWRISFSKFEKENPKSAKILSKGRRSKKYQSLCYEIKRNLRQPLDEKIFKEAFDNAML